MRDRILKSPLGNGENDPQKRNICPRFVVIVPESCYGPPVLDQISDAIKVEGAMPYSVDRGGIKARSYKSTVYRIHDDKNDRVQLRQYSCRKVELFVNTEIHVEHVNLYTVWLASFKIIFNNCCYVPRIPVCVLGQWTGLGFVIATRVDNILNIREFNQADGVYLYMHPKTSCNSSRMSPHVESITSVILTALNCTSK